MNIFNRKVKPENSNQSRSNSKSSSSSTPKKQKNPVSESDSKSEKTVVTKPGSFRKRVDAASAKSRVESPQQEKRNTAQKIKKAVASLSLSPARNQKTPPSAGEDRKKHAPKSEKDAEKVRKSKEYASLSLSGSNELSLKHLNSEMKPLRSERSLIGLDGESDFAYDRKTVTKKPTFSSPSSVKGSSSQEDSSTSETKDSISLAEDEEQRDTFKKLFKELGMSTQKLTLDDFLLDFNSLPGDPAPEQCTAYNSPLNTKKNRYTNIPCLDSSRVRLTFMATKKEPSSEYIHANYIKSAFLKREYILTQGPKKETFADFWRMVWQEKSTAIVMLCQFVETNREKCFEYFPRNANCTMRFDKLMLTYEESTVHKSMVTTRLKLHYEGESRIITHFQWKEWPDYQVPGSSEIILKILRKIRAKSTPPIVHCAAGVGRSGSLISIEIALQAIHSHHKVPDIKQIVTDLRLTGRASAVQTVQQYMLIWKVVLDFGVSNKLIGEEIVGKFASTYRRSFRSYTTS
ncbi:unnamed protein product [Caenorhabditis sp. 36 PRJEB53466]|nr:unnamed protein product [Caenorhabditis sp. 36 PRJEB53466]